MQVIHKTDTSFPYFSAIENNIEIGKVNYHKDEDGVMKITYVGVDYEHRGKGKAKELMMEVIEYARRNKIKIVPICSYAVAVFERYPEVRDVLLKKNEK